MNSEPKTKKLKQSDDKAQKKLEKEQEKAKKQAERERIKAENAKAKEEKQKLALAYKNLKPDECIKVRKIPNKLMVCTKSINYF